MKCSSSQCKKVPTIRCKCNSSTSLLFCFTHFQEHYDTCGKLPDAISKKVIEKSKALDNKISAIEAKITESTQSIIRSIEQLSANVLAELQTAKETLCCTSEGEIDQVYENVKEICKNFQLDCIKNSYFFDNTMDVLFAIRHEDVGAIAIDKKVEYLENFRYDLKGIEGIKEIFITNDEAYVFICDG